MSSEYREWTVRGLKADIAETEAKLTSLRGKLQELLDEDRHERRRGGLASSPPEVQPGGKRRRTMSAEARQRLSESMRERWAQRKGTDTHGEVEVESVGNK